MDTIVANWRAAIDSLYFHGGSQMLGKNTKNFWYMHLHEPGTAVRLT